MLEFSRLDAAAAFVAVCDLGSFRAAGQRLGRDPTAVSKRVAALERRLGVRLLNRTTRSLSLTEPGAAYLEAARAALAALAEAESRTQGLGEPRGMLRLTAPTSFGRLWLAPILPDFFRRHPLVRVDVTYSNIYMDLVADGFDLAIRSGVLSDSGLVARKLAQRRRVVVASPAYIAACGEPRSPHDLAHHNCLVFAGLPDGPRWSFARDGRALSVQVSGNLISNDADALVDAAARGVGLFQCADWLVGGAISKGVLTPVLEDWSEVDEGGIYLVTPPPGLLPVPGKTRAFIDWIVEAMRPVPWIAED